MANVVGVDRALPTVNTLKAEVPHAASNASDNDWDRWMDWDPISPSDRASTPPVPLSTSPHDPQRSSTDDNESRKPTLIADEGGASPPPAKKRKASMESADSATRSGSHDGKSTSIQNKSHSIVEKRYRANLNEKIADLRRSIPSLRNAASTSAETGDPSTAPKHNKSTILTKAIEYIHHLEQRITYLENINASLRSQARNIKSEVVQDGVTPRAEIFKSPSTDPEDSPSTTQDFLLTSNGAQGLIPVPDDIRRLQNTAPQEHYADRISSVDREPRAHFSITGGKLLGKLMVGSLAGLMVFMGEQKARENDRGLFALPFSTSLPTFSPLWVSHGHLASSHFARLLLLMIKGFLAFSILGLILFMYLFNSKPKHGLKPAVEEKLRSRSSASPIEMRENAWLTAVQTLKVPRHSWFPEMIALVLETDAYIVRQLLGWDIYSWLMGRSEGEEIARVRAWDIAIDAQLTGGDAEVSRSRLVLTVWAAGTLPKTPARLMLKALHLRIMFWQASRWPRICWAFDLAASQLARYQWTLAKQMLDTVDVATGSEDFEPLSDHLLALLQRPAEDVMTDLTVQQAHNLCWNRSATTISEDVGVDDIAEDTAMRGPLDALALWSSSLVLQEAMSNFLESGETSPGHLSQVEIALRTAPPGSSSSLRALAAKTIFCAADRNQNINKLLETLSSSSAVSFPGSVSENHAFSATVCNDVLTCIGCAEALDALAGLQSDPISLDRAVQFVDRICSDVKSQDVLALAATYNLILVLINDSAHTGQFLCSLKQVILSTVLQMNKTDSKTRSRAQDRFKEALQRLQLQRRSSNTSVESGYISM